jgi:hydroxymethylbilane synthase
LQGRSEDAATRTAVAAISDDATLHALTAERALAFELKADCDTPLGAYAELDAQAETISLRAWVGLPDGSAWAYDEQQGPAADPRALARSVAERLRAVGAQELLDQARLEVARER